MRVGRKVIQQTVAHLGELDAEGRARAKALARAITGDREQADLFEPGNADEAIPIRLKGIRLERGRSFGDGSAGRCGGPSASTKCWSAGSPSGEKRSPGPRWPPSR